LIVAKQAQFMSYSPISVEVYFVTCTCTI